MSALKILQGNYKGKNLAYACVWVLYNEWERILKSYLFNDSICKPVL